MYKIRFLFSNLQRMSKVIRTFSWHQKFVPKGLYALAQGLCTDIKSLKMCIKSYFEIILKLATYGQREKAFLLSSKFCPQYLVCPSSGLYTCGKTWKNVYKIILQRDCFKTCNKWAKWQLLTSTFVPTGLSAPALGLYTCIKALKYIPGPGVMWLFTGPLVIWFSSPEPKTQWWAFRIGRPPSSVVWHPHSLNIFSSETTGPIKVKFHIELLWDGGTKVCSKVQVTRPRWPPYILKNLLRNRKTGELEIWYAASGAWVLPSCSNDDPILWQGQIWSLMFLYGKKGKTIF